MKPHRNATWGFARVVLSAWLGSVAGIWTLHADESPPAKTPASQPTSSPAIDEQLVKKLLGGESSSVDTVEATLQEMDRAATQIEKDGDVGPRTQLAQRRVVDGIDQLIDQARRNRASQAAPPQGRRQSERRDGEGRRTRGSPAGRAGPSERAAAGPRGDTGSGGSSGKTRDRGKTELERGWGFLPPRDRAEISQGFDAEFNEKYREVIIRYYRNLAEAAQESGRAASDSPGTKESPR